MNTQQLVSLLKNDFAPGYARTKLLSYLARAQNELFNSDCAQTKFYNGSDSVFPVPILSTTAGTLKYTLSESNLVDSDGNAISLTQNGYDVTIRRIARVFINVSSLSTAYDNTFIGRTFDWSGVNESWSKKVYNIRYREVPAILFDATYAEGAHLVFAEDPGTHTDKYYVEFYTYPISLDSELIPMSVDIDKWAEALIKAVRGYIEESRNGRTDLLDGPAYTGSFRRYWLPKFRNSENFGTEMKQPYVFETRECL
jgi:hypothetical protein